MNITTDKVGNPCGLDGPRKPVAVRRILDFWRYGGRWWEAQAPRYYYLLELETGHVVEVYRSTDTWVLSRISD